MRVLAGAQLWLWDADCGQQFDDPVVDAAASYDSVGVEDFADLGADGAQRVERCQRVLQDESDVVAA